LTYNAFILKPKEEDINYNGVLNYKIPIVTFYCKSMVINSWMKYNVYFLSVLLFYG